MLTVDEARVDLITEAIYHLLGGRVPDPIPISDAQPDDELKQLTDFVNRLLVAYAELARVLERLAAGELDSPPLRGRLAVISSLKTLQSNLRHLTWKTQQIAAGDLDQVVDFMGDFSVAFNTMTQKLKDAFRTIEEHNEKLRQANLALREEQDKSERLLLNVLPAPVAEDLKQHGHSEPQLFDPVTVFFSDVVGFTALSARISPGELIAELNAMFTRFDEIFAAHGCERIKTIGDAYLAICGMPEPVADHAERMVRAATEVMAYVSRRQEQRGGWAIRAGLSSGPVVGGIVGIKKYIYDVFGDTINTASRMESSSEPMRVNVSETTWRLVRDQFAFVDRGTIDVKGKGPVRMFFLAG